MIESGAGTRLGRQETRRCPCNEKSCVKWVVWPLFDRPEASTDIATADEIVRRLNHFEPNGSVER